MRRVDVAQALIERDGRILAVRNRPHESWREEFWGLPGGRVEAGESLAEAAARETLEETGARIVVDRLVAVGESLRDTHVVFFVFAARLVDGEPALQPAEEVVVELCWLEPEQADALMPWYPGGVRALLTAREPLYYVERE